LSNLLQLGAYSVSDFLYALSVGPLSRDVGLAYLPAYAEGLFTALLSCVLVNRLALFGLREIEVGPVGPYDLLLGARAVDFLTVRAAPLAPEMSFAVPGRSSAELLVPARGLSEGGIFCPRYLTKRLRLAACR
jgi:hypothetical protein